MSASVGAVALGRLLRAAIICEENCYLTHSWPKNVEDGH